MPIDIACQTSHSCICQTSGTPKQIAHKKKKDYMKQINSGNVIMLHLNSSFRSAKSDLAYQEKKEGKVQPSC